MTIYNQIKKDSQIWKFCFYGLLKNLRFFEPYLWIYLLSLGLNLFKIGLLFSIKEIITYIFEIPSGIFADNYGRKKELMICFTFYIISFVLFFIGTNFYLLSLAMIFFGLGEAFRSGTHKAMIYSYLEQKEWFEYKTFVYGRTRSFSLIGSSISAFLSIIFVLNLPTIRWIFLLCIVPYILDFLLIWSYPNSLDERRKTSLSIAEFLKQIPIQLKSIFTNKLLTKVLLSSSLYNGIFKTIKDYIQPILKSTLLVFTISYFNDFNKDAIMKIYLGIIYGVFYIFSSIASRNVYRLNNKYNSSKLMNIFFDIMGIACFALFAAIKNNFTIIIIIIFFILYLLKDARRPLVVAVCGDNMSKHERATVMSVDSQLKSLFSIVLAPLFGYIADKYSIYALFLFIGIFIIVINRFLYLHTKNPD
ncbi:galactoside permease [Clostridium tepidiprofundi DSM 19306]|uniref:Galactoside permease n=1 Tax=Clostridium tepidiprofundi DSM 19306 TaxID=1121338 RepID=A0A151B5B2_9CLOT|nr:MFS transporter [Clostridium tepidiprofundi]KYH34847.1 galactoside permease [Clostridium tepidiprofundi DSM 19306]